jgi:hypothetical protein
MGLFVLGCGGGGCDEERDHIGGVEFRLEMCTWHRMLDVLRSLVASGLVMP